MMSKIGIAAVCLALLLVGVFYVLQENKSFINKSFQTTTAEDSEAERFQEWKEFVPRSRLFKVSLPNPPQYAKDFVEIPGSDKKRRYDMYASEKIDGTLFLITVITYPSDLSFTQTIDDVLKQTVDELLRSKADNQLTNLKNNLFKTYPSIDFSIDSKEFLVEGKVFMKEKMMYILSYVSKKDAFDIEEFDYYIHSFDLLDPKSSAAQKEHPMKS